MIIHKEYLTIGVAESGKKILFELTCHQPGTDKIYWNAKDPCEAKLQLLINKHEFTGLKHFNDSKAFVEYLNRMEDIYKNIEAHNSNKKSKTLIVFDDMVADLLRTEKTNAIAKLFFRGRKPKFILLLSHNLILLYQKILD